MVVRGRVERWVIHYAYKRSHNDRNTQMCVCFCYISSTKIQILQGNLKGLFEVFKVEARTGDQRSRPGITHICVE